MKRITLHVKDEQYCPDLDSNLLVMQSEKDIELNVLIEISHWQIIMEFEVERKHVRNQTLQTVPLRVIWYEKPDNAKGGIVTESWHSTNQAESKGRTV